MSGDTLVRIERYSDTQENGQKIANALTWLTVYHLFLEKLPENQIRDGMAYRVSGYIYADAVASKGALRGE